MEHDEALAVAQEMLKREPLFDGHNDLPWVIRQDRAARGDVIAYDLTRVHEKGDTDIPRLREGQVGAQFWAAFQPTSAPHPARTTLEQIDLIRRIGGGPSRRVLARAHAPRISRARKQAGKIASYIVVEGGVGLENALAPLRIWHAAGARMLIPCHNETLDWVNSATDAPRHGGFNAFGRAVIAECNRLGMIVDGAHVSPRGHAPPARRQRGADPALAFQRLRAVRPSAQRARRRAARLKDNGGVVMATFVPGFVSQALRELAQALARRLRQGAARADPKAQLAELEARHGRAPRATLAEVADHIVYLVETAGIDHVGIGSDFFGGAAARSASNTSAASRISSPNCCDAASPRRDLEKIASRNVLRVMREVEAGRRDAARDAPAGGRADRGLSGGVGAAAPHPLLPQGAALAPPSSRSRGAIALLSGRTRKRLHAGYWRRIPLAGQRL